MWCRRLIWFLGVMFLVGPVQGELEFGIPTPVPSPINDDGAYLYPWLTNDELTMFYATTRGRSSGCHRSGVLNTGINRRCVEQSRQSGCPI